jgi:3',5'-cyclic AMP phosphodiesterase CpdA
MTPPASPPRRPVLIAQISDLHLGFVVGDPGEANRLRLDAVVAHLARMDPAPDHVVVSGDLTEHGDPAAYVALREALQGLPCPASVMAGNHDRRADLVAAFPEAGAPDGFVHQAIDVGGLRVLLLDTLEEGRHGGAFCTERAAWLATELDRGAATPTLVFLHHPPIVSGIGWMDPSPAEPWIERLGTVIEGRDQIVALASGHLHRPVATQWRGRPLYICPSTAPELALGLAPIDPSTPDDRALIVSAAPGFTLYRWDGDRLIAHFGSVGGEVVARFTLKLQPMIAHLAEEQGRV